MSGYTSVPRVFVPAAPFADRSATPPLVRRARALWARLALMRRVAETRRELGTLDPRLLSDIGVGRAEAARESERWPWDTAP